MRILVVAPHADDEAYGCGGMIARRTAEGHAVDIVIVSIGEVRRGGEVKCTAEQRRQEMREAARALGAAEPKVLFDGYENKLDTLPRVELMNRLDALATAGYDQVFLPVPSHHQDHQIVFQAGFAALRPRGTPGPSLVAAYEYPYVGWSPEEPRGGRWYVDISATIEKKKAALAAYRTQAASPPHPLSWEAVETLARQRGFESGFRHAEIFHVLRMSDPAR